MTELKDRFCPKPWEQVEISKDAGVRLCCGRWLPTWVGNLGEASLTDVFNSATSQEIRRSILAGDFSHCRKEVCPFIQDGSLPTRQEVLEGHRVTWNGANVATERNKTILREQVVRDVRPRFLHLSYDESCNLSCPSCRPERIQLFRGEQYELSRRIQQKVVEHVFAEPHDEYVHVSITGSGDPFGSKLFRELLLSVDGSKFPNVRFNLQTNGVMFTPAYWEKLSRIHENIDTVMVSCDAATPETYVIVRRGGRWDVLMRNLAFLSELRREGRIARLRLDCVVQRRNYREMPGLARLGIELGVDRVFFSEIDYWEASEMAVENDYEDHAVWKPSHPEYARFQEVLATPIMAHPIVDLGNLSGHVGPSRSLMRRIQRRLVGMRFRRSRVQRLGA